MIKIDKDSFSRLKTKTYIIKGLNLYKGSLHTLCARGGQGKTFFLQYLAVCAAVGKKLFDKYEINEKLKILHIDQEQGNDQTITRYIRLSNGVGYNGDLPIDRLVIPRLDIKNKDSWKLINLEGYDLVLIDSLKALSNADENSGEAEELLKYLKYQAEIHNTCLLIITHKGKYDGGALQSARGHSSLYDSLDGQIDLSLDPKTLIFTLHCQKSRDDIPFEDVFFSFKDDGEYIPNRNCTSKILFNLVENPNDDFIFNIFKIINENSGINQVSICKKIKCDKHRLITALLDLQKENHIQLIKGNKNANLYYATSEGQVHYAE